MAQIDIKRATIIFRDGDSPVNEIDVKIGEGNFTWSEKKNIMYIKDRGLLDGTREGDEEPMEVSCDARWDTYLSTGAEAVTPVEAAKQQGAASAWVSTGPACEPYAIDLIIDYDSGCGSVVDERLTFPDFRFESIDFDLRAGTIAFKGKCNAVEPTVLRTAV